MTTEIGWTWVPDGKGGTKIGRTWNAQIGCKEVSPACRSCYAAKLAHRGMSAQHRGLTIMRANAAGENLGVHWNGEINRVPGKLAEPLSWRKPSGIFVGSMTDLFFDVGSDDACRWIAAIFGIMAACPQHTFMVLTKRPENAKRWFATPGISELVRTYKHVALAGRISELFADERTEPVAGWPGYFITSKGRVLSDRTNAGKRGASTHEVSQMASDGGHRRVMMYGDNGPERFLIHRMVLTAFDREAKPGEQCCHIDGDPTNNALWNLRWGSQSDNWDDRKRHGNRRSYAKLSVEQVNEIRRRWSGGPTTKALAAEFGVSGTQIRNIGTGKQWGPEPTFTWPLPQVWVGVTAEDQRRADLRVPVLLELPAAVRFVSYEPACGPVDWSAWLPRRDDRLEDERCPACDGDGVVPGSSCPSLRPDHDAVEKGEDGPVCAECGLEYVDEDLCRECAGTGYIDLPSLDWVIAGGESGPGARPSHPDWFRSTRDQCEAAGVPYFHKQNGVWAEVGQAANDTEGRPGALEWTHMVSHSTGRAYAAGEEMPIMEVASMAFMRKVGKDDAGRDLDGRVHDGFPEER